MEASMCFRRSTHCFGGNFRGNRFHESVDVNSHGSFRRFHRGFREASVCFVRGSVIHFHGSVGSFRGTCGSCHGSFSIYFRAKNKNTLDRVYIYHSSLKCKEDQRHMIIRIPQRSGHLLSNVYGNWINTNNRSLQPPARALTQLNSLPCMPRPSTNYL